jgi:hypothetical protein
MIKNVFFVGILALSASVGSAYAQTVSQQTVSPDAVVAMSPKLRTVAPGSVSPSGGNDMGTQASDLNYNSRVPTASGNGGGGN